MQRIFVAYNLIGVDNMTLDRVEYLLVFISNNFATLVYSNLKKKDYNIELISTPCSISSGCSHSIRFPEEYLDEMKEQAEKNKLCVKGIYKISRVEDKIQYVPIIKY